MGLEWLNDPAMLAPADAVRIPHMDGSFLLRSPDPLKPYARCVGEWLEHWAAATPDALAFAERDGHAGWTRLTWREARQRVGAIAQGLLDLRMPAGAPVTILSDNSVEHLLLALAAMHVGIPVCAVSSAYSRLTKDYTKISGILATLRPGLLYASDPAVYGPAIVASGQRVPVFFGRVDAAADGGVAGARPFAALAARETPAVMQRYAAVTPDTHAKYLLTSGSTGHPKVVINTQRMLCANQQAIAQVWRFLEHKKPVIVDWLPWSHTFGANHNLNMALRNGGTFVVDEGRPAPGLVERTVANLADIKPTIWFNVPRGFDMALPLLEADDEVARRVFERLRVVFYAGAAMPQATWDRLQRLSVRITGEESWLTTAWGSTETAPAITSAHWRLARAGVIGAVLPGLDLKFVPNAGKLEMRVRGVSIFPGYRDEPELTAQAFDTDWYYRIGDAGYLVDEHHPEYGVAFDGRVAEDFKLTTGTWVSVGTLRVHVVSVLAPYVQDVVITGHDRSEVGILVFPNPQGAALPADALARHVAQGLARLAAEGSGSSHTPKRAWILTEPPSVDAGEITDKGYINQRAVLTRRAAFVARMYDSESGTIAPARAPD